MLRLSQLLGLRLERKDSPTEQRAAVLRTILQLILVAAIVTAPLYLIGEAFDLSHLSRVLMINGGTAFGAVALLLLVKRGRARLVAQSAVWALYAMISWLAATNGEPIHVNVVNFVLVLVLANILLTGREVALVTLACATAMAGIAYHQLLLPNGANSRELFFENVVQFLPQFVLIAVLLRKTSRKVILERT